MLVKELTTQEFINFTNSYPIKSIYQTSEYGFVMNEQGYESMFIGVINNDKIIGASLILIQKESGFKYAYAPRGFLINYEDFYLINDFTENVKEFFNKKGIIAIKINPPIVKGIFDFSKQSVERNELYDNTFEALIHNEYNHLGYNNFFEALKPRFEAIIDLHLTINCLFKNVKKEYRTKIRSAVNSGIEVYKGNKDNLDILYNFTKDKYERDINYFNDVYDCFSKTNKIDYYYTKLNTKTYLKYIQEKLINFETESNNINNKIIKNKKKSNTSLIDKKINIDKYLDKYKNELIEATQMLRQFPDGIITSAIIIIKTGNTATILIDGYDKTYQKFNSKHLLIWDLITAYKKEGFDSFNLGGVSNIMTDVNKYSGLNDFKISFGAKMYEYAGDFELITNKRGYNLYRNYVPLKNLIKSKLTK